MVTMQEESDRNIILRLQRRDETALAYLMEKYRRYLQVVAMKSAGQWLSVQDIEEVTADVFMEVWNHADRIRLQNSRIKTYMAAIATNFAVNRIRKEQYKKREINVALSELESYGNKVEIEEEVVNKVTFSEIEHAFIYLTPAERRCFEDYYMGSYEYEEICEKYDMTQNALRMTLRRAREKIKRVLRVNGFVAVAAAVLVSLGMVYAAGFHAVHRNRLLDRPMDEVVCEARYDTDVRVSNAIQYGALLDVTRNELDYLVKSVQSDKYDVKYNEITMLQSLQIGMTQAEMCKYIIPTQIVVNNGISVLQDCNGEEWDLHGGDQIAIHFENSALKTDPRDIYVGCIRDNIMESPELVSMDQNDCNITIAKDGKYYFYIMGASSDTLVIKNAVLYIQR